MDIVNVQKVKPKGKPKKKPKLSRRELNGRVFRTMGDDVKLAELASELGYNPYVVRRWHRMFDATWAQKGLLR